MQSVEVKRVAQAVASASTSTVQLVVNSGPQVSASASQAQNAAFAVLVQSSTVVSEAQPVASFATTTVQAFARAAQASASPAISTRHEGTAAVNTQADVVAPLGGSTIDTAKQLSSSVAAVAQSVEAVAVKSVAMQVPLIESMQVPSCVQAQNVSALQVSWSVKVLQGAGLK